MERLTEDSVTGETYIKHCASSCPYDGDFCGTDECPVLNAVSDKLGEYERAEEQGLLVRLPCKVGDTLYCIDNGIVELLIVNSFKIYNFNRIEIDFENASGFALCTFSGELDEGYFLTYEEAAKKLEEMKNDGSKK